MIDALSRRRGEVYGLLALYFAVNLVLRLAQPQSLELDEGQQLFLAQWLAVGYDSQPPLYNWLQYGVVQFLGDTVLALSALKNLMLFLCYGLVGLAARIVIRDRRLAIIAVLGMLTIPQISFEAQRDLTHTIAVLFAACLFIYALFSALERPSLFHYALTGVAIGLGVISKYNFVLLPLAAILAILAEPAFRKRLFDARILLTILAAALIATPHALWFLDHMQVATDRTLDKLSSDGEGGHLADMAEGLISLVGALAAFSLVTVAVFWAAFGRRLLNARAAENQWTRLIGRMFLLMVAALVLLVVVGGVSHIKGRWLTPFFFLLPLYLALKIDVWGGRIGQAPRRFAMVAILIMVAVPLVLFARVPAAWWTGDYKKINVPYGPAIEAILATHKERPAMIATEDQQLAGNIRLHAAGIPVMIPGYEAFQEPTPFDGTHPLLLIWRDDGKPDAALPAALKAWRDRQLAPGAVAPMPEPTDIALPYHYGRPGDLYHFRYAWIYP